MNLTPLHQFGTDLLYKYKIDSSKKDKAFSQRFLTHIDAIENLFDEVKKDERKIVVSDNGIGMNKEDMLQNLGTIAKSGTETSMQLLEEPIFVLIQLILSWTHCFISIIFSA